MSDDRRYSREYDDIIDLPHHTSSKHARLPMSSRAAQFAPFAALTGFEGVIAEEGRLTDSFTELDDDMKEDIDLKLEMLGGMAGESPEATFTYFVPDSRRRQLQNCHRQDKKDRWYRKDDHAQGRHRDQDR